MKYILPSIRNCFFTLFTVFLLSTAFGPASVAQGCQQEISYRVAEQSSKAAIYLTATEETETYTIVLFSTANGIKEVSKKVGIRLRKGEEQLVFNQVDQAHYVIQVINQSGCHFVVNGMKGVSVE